jgi:hypothetical protein
MNVDISPLPPSWQRMENGIDLLLFTSVPLFGEL